VRFPLFYELTENEVKWVCKSVKRFFTD